MSLSLCEAHDTRGLKALPLNFPPGSTVYGDAGYTDYLTEDDIQEIEGITLAIMRKKNSRRPDKPYVAYIKQHLRHAIETVFSQITQFSQIYSCGNNGWLFDENSDFYHGSHFGISFNRLDSSVFTLQYLLNSVSTVLFSLLTCFLALLTL